MTLTDPREALADQSNFISYLVGLAALGRLVHSLAADPNRVAGSSAEPSDFVHLLLGVARLGDGVERLASHPPAQIDSTSETPSLESPDVRWLR
jgi:hypothetical protein